MTSEQQLFSSTLRYLTGEMAGEERDSFETRLLVDHDFSDAVAVCEQELIDALVLGQLDSTQARSVRLWVDATPARRERVRTARALLQKKPPTSGARRQWLAVIMAAAACVLVAMALTVHKATTKPPAAETTVAGAVSSPQELTPAQGGTEKSQVILLVAERLRGEEPMAKYQMHPDAPIELQVLVTGKAPDTLYTLKIISSEPKRHVLVERKGLKLQEKQGHPYIEVTLPAGSLPAATYNVVVSERDERLLSSFAVR